jgi:CubicO group peptidase (beta-lactamase class C family)
MTAPKPFFRLFSVFVLCLAVLTAQLQRPVLAQQTAAKPAASATDYSTALATIEKALDDRRKELGIPGISLAIVKDDQVIYLKGLGVKDVDK